jgi:hypothetical protein
VIGISRSLLLLLPVSFVLVGCAPGFTVNLEGVNSGLHSASLDSSGDSSGSIGGGSSNGPLHYDTELQAIFVEVLGRQPTLAELSSWRVQNQSGRSFADIRRAVATSDESRLNARSIACDHFNSCSDTTILNQITNELASGKTLVAVTREMRVATENSIGQLYEGVLLRKADLAGLEFHVGDARSFSRSSIEEGGFRASVEFSIHSTYRGVLQRNADAAGLRYWYDEIKEGKILLEELGNVLRFSDEYADVEAGRRSESLINARIALQSSIQSTYLDVLGRTPTVAEFFFAEDAINKDGRTLSDIKNSLVASSEMDALLRGHLGGHFALGANVAEREKLKAEIRAGSSLLTVIRKLEDEKIRIIEGFFQTHLRRRLDVRGFNLYVNNARNGHSKGDVETAIANSVESQIGKLYRSILGREVDTPSLIDFLGKVQNQGWTIDRVRTEIMKLR